MKIYVGEWKDQFSEKCILIIYKWQKRISMKTYLKLGRPIQVNKCAFKRLGNINVENITSEIQKPMAHKNF